MKRLLKGSVPIFALALALVGCSHNQPQTESGQEQQQPGQYQQNQQNQAAGQSGENLNQQEEGQAQASEQGQMGGEAQSNAEQPRLGQEHLSQGTAEIQRQKKVVKTEIVRQKIPTIRQTTTRADINRMNANQFAAIGFPKDVAQNIVQYRNNNGPFQSVNDLANVQGISPSLLGQYRDFLGVATQQAGQVGETSQAGQSLGTTSTEQGTSEQGGTSSEQGTAQGEQGGAQNQNQLQNEQGGSESGNQNDQSSSNQNSNNQSTAPTDLSQ